MTDAYILCHADFTLDIAQQGFMMASLRIFSLTATR